MVNKVVSISGFFVRHLVASLVSVVAPVILWGIAYLVLLLIAIFNNTGLGGPLALPFWAVFFLIAGAISTTLLLFPSVLIAETATRHLGKWRHLAQIPVSTLALAGLIHLASQLAHLRPGYSESSFLFWADYPWILFLALAIPLGIYWWTMKAVQTGLFIPAAVFKWLHKEQVQKPGKAI